MLCNYHRTSVFYHVLYTYIEKKPEPEKAKVVVKHIVKDDDGNVISETMETLTGDVGDDYETKPDPNKGEVVTITGDPEKGTFSNEDKEVIYTYIAEAGTVTAKYVYIDNNGNQINLVTPKVIKKAVGENYQTEKLDKIGDYVLVKVNGDESGKITKNDKEVVYIYRKKTADKPDANDDDDDDDVNDDDDSDVDDDDDNDNDRPQTTTTTEPPTTTTKPDDSTVPETPTVEPTPEITTVPNDNQEIPVIPRKPKVVDPVENKTELSTVINITNPEDLPLPKGRVFKVVDDKGEYIATVKIADDGSYLIIDDDTTPLGTIKISRNGEAELIELVNLDIPLAVGGKLPKTGENNPFTLYLLALLSFSAGFILFRKK